MVKLSREEFDRGAVALARAFSRLGSDESASNDQRKPWEDLDRWYVEGAVAGDGNGAVVDPYYRQPIHLVHPPVLREIPCYQHEGDSVEKKEPLIYPEGADGDNDDVVEDTATINSATASAHRWSEWILSIAYSDTWGVPVLYFRAQNLDGMRLARKDILHAVGWLQSNGKDSHASAAHDGEGDIGAAGGWTFLSEDEHPVTGAPSFFLHPCRTSERLNVLLRTVASNEAGITGGGADRIGLGSHVLLSWMSMILPAIQFRIGADKFTHLLALLAHPSKEPPTY